MSRLQPAAIRFRYWRAALVCALLLVLLRCSPSDPVESAGSVNPQQKSKASGGPVQVHESSEIKAVPGSRETSSGLLPAPAPGPEKDPTSSPKAAANANGRSANLNKYLSYFDSICPLLSENEEDEVLRRNNRSPEVLVALALLRSKRGGAFLKEAVKGDVPPPIALYGVLSRAVYDGDRVAAAQKLGGAYGDLFLASHYAAEGKSNPEILDALNRAAQSSDQLKPWLVDVRRLQEEIFVSVGRDPLGASARALLESRGSSESTMLTAVERQLTSSGALADSVRGPAAIASLLALNQQLLETQGFDLGAHASARSQEGIEDLDIRTRGMAAESGGTHHVRIQNCSRMAGHSELRCDGLMLLLQGIKRSIPVEAR